MCIARTDTMIGLRRIEELRAEASYHSERYQLYKAKMYGPRPVSGVRLRELERRSLGADTRLRHALHENSPGYSPSLEEE
jgi:hypothetical protein